MAEFDPYYHTNVTFLMHMDGTNDTAPSVDERGHAVTSAGNVLLKTATKKFGTASAYFPGAAGDVLTVADSADFEFGSGDFTIEFWVMPSSTLAMEFITKDAGAPGFASYSLGQAGSGTLRLDCTTTGSSYDIHADSATGVVASGVWAHLALVRNGDVFTAYHNGVAVATTTVSGALVDNAGPLILGSRGADFNIMTGYMDDVRITKGLARYTADFTPPVAAFVHGGGEEDVVETGDGSDAVAPVSLLVMLVTQIVDSIETTQQAVTSSTSDSADATSTPSPETVTRLYEAVAAYAVAATSSATAAALADSASLTDIIQQAINQVVADIAAGVDTLNLGAALTLVDIADAVATQTPSYNSVLLVAELIATLEAYNGADAYDVTESGALSDAYVARVEALVAMLEAAQAVDTNTALVHVMQSATDTADGGETITSSGSLLNALLSDSALATIRISIGGEVFTGWVLNTDTMAPSEYQFADLQFNSACKHGTRYLMAADDGIYEFTEATGVETVMTYIKTGKTDFGSDLKKRVVNAYVVYSASAQMVLKVTTSEFGNLVTRNYRMTPQADDTTDARRVDIGRGVKSRYWQFEVVGDGVDCAIDEIGMLPIVLSRRI